MVCRDSSGNTASLSDGTTEIRRYRRGGADDRHSRVLLRLLRDLQHACFRGLWVACVPSLCHPVGPRHFQSRSLHCVFAAKTDRLQPTVAAAPRGRLATGTAPPGSGDPDSDHIVETAGTSAVS